VDLAEIYRVLRRRWYVLLPGLLLTAALTVGVYVLVPTKYQSQATVELLNSQKATVAFDGNPFLSTQASLTGMADSLARSLESDAVAADLKSQGMTSTYQAKIADNAMGPLVWLTVTGTNQKHVLSDDQLLVDYAGQRLKQFQADQSVAPDAMIRTTVIVPPQQPTAQTKTKLEYLAIAALLGLVLSLVASFFVDQRRKHKETPDGRGQAGPQGGPVEPDQHGGAAAGELRDGDPAGPPGPRTRRLGRVRSRADRAAGPAVRE
jgi:hypothetical protein